MCAKMPDELCGLLLRILRYTYRYKHIKHTKNKPPPPLNSEANTLLCDFHREQAWLKKQQITPKDQDVVLKLWRAIGNSATQEGLQEATEAWGNSLLNSNNMMQYFNTTWMSHKEVWIYILLL